MTRSPIELFWTAKNTEIYIFNEKLILISKNGIMKEDKIGENINDKVHLMFVRIGLLACLPPVLRCKCDSAKPLLRDWLAGEVKKL